jgi:hypothetical protein
MLMRVRRLIFGGSQMGRDLGDVRHRNTVASALRSHVKPCRANLSRDRALGSQSQPGSVLLGDAPPAK